jgi:hypothetical protein
MDDKTRALAVGRGVPFTGTIVRVEPDGFGVVEFNEPIGLQANTHGVFSLTLGSTVPYGPNLKPGAAVSGIAQVDQHDLAAVMNLEVTRS